jgi:geranylgeranyl transferase type-2 subunit beta
VLDAEVCDDVRGFLLDVRGDDGGFQANRRIPFSDALSTFTGLLTAQDVGAPRLLEIDELRELVAGQLEFPTGGFRAAAWDSQADVEYTFYGLGTLALISQGPVAAGPGAHRQSRH